MRREQRRQASGVTAGHAALGGYSVNTNMTPSGRQAGGIAGVIVVVDQA